MSARSRLSWRVALIAALMLALGLVLLFFLTQATRQSNVYESYYNLLFTTNVVVAAILFLAIIWVGWRLFSRWRRGKFGSQLQMKLALMFAFVGCLPGILIYGVSYQFVSRSIETWFDVQVETALNSGLTLARHTVLAMEHDAVSQASQVAKRLAHEPVDSGLALAHLRDELDAMEILVWQDDDKLYASSGYTPIALSEQLGISHQLIRELKNKNRLGSAGLDEVFGAGVAHIQGIEEMQDALSTGRKPGPVYIYSMVPIDASGSGWWEQPRYLEIRKSLPQDWIMRAVAVQSAHQAYQERSLAREGLKRMYIGTLTLSLFLSIFGSVLLAVVLGRYLMRPLLLLADGVRQVAAGDLRPIATLDSNDELAGLTRAFADMTEQISQARSEVSMGMAKLEATREHLQTVLDHLTAGVMLLDQTGVILSANPGATRILRSPVAAFLGQHFVDVPGLSDFASDVLGRFSSLFEQKGETERELDYWQASFDLTDAMDAPNTVVDKTSYSIMARGATLPDGSWLLVLDDVTDIVSMQRMQAWAEVARRLAHEIKNPLTPIQLSAERLRMKLFDRLAGADQALLKKSVDTIVVQVQALQRLVNEFRDYARLPHAELKPVDLNELVQELAQMYVGEGVAVEVSLLLDKSCPKVLADAQQLRQVLHNLIQNAQDAMMEKAKNGVIAISTRWLTTANRVRLRVRDEGGGFAEPILQRALEPYVTTKVHGTGLGLALVKKIADEHGAELELKNILEGDRVIGAQVSLSLRPHA